MLQSVTCKNNLVLLKTILNDVQTPKLIAAFNISTASGTFIE